MTKIHGKFYESDRIPEDRRRLSDKVHCWM